MKLFNNRITRIGRCACFLAIFICFTSTTFNVKGQQRPRYSQYMFNGLALNPAYAGSHDALDITALYRVQWSNVDGAPRTGTLALHTPVKDRNIGIGAIIVNDRIGVTRETGGLATFSYTIKTTSRYHNRGKSGFFNDIKISMGIQAGFNQYANNLSELQTFNGVGGSASANGDDPVFSQNDVSTFIFDLGTGIYIHNENFYIGISSPNLIKSSYQIENTLQSSKERHYFANFGAVFPIVNGLKVKPNLLFRGIYFGDLQMDTNVNFLVKERFWIGVSYRHEESIVGIFEFIVNNRIRIGYSYDYGINKFTRITGGSHEMMLNYYLKYKKQLLINPRYF